MYLKQHTKGSINITPANTKLFIMDPAYKTDSKLILTLDVEPGIWSCSYYMGDACSEKDIKESTDIYNSVGNEFPAFKEQYPTLDAYLAYTHKDIRSRCFALILTKGYTHKTLNNSKWIQIAKIGVDSGMAGLFPNKSDFTDDDWDKFDRICRTETDAWKRQNLGFWSHSGYGDGSYPVSAIYEKINKKPVITALKLEF